MSYSVATSVFSLGGWRRGRGGRLPNIGHEHDSCQAEKAENTDPGTNYAVKHAAARGHLMCVCVCVSLLSTPDPARTVGLMPPTPPHDPHPRSRIRARKQLRDLPLGRTTF